MQELDILIHTFKYDYKNNGILIILHHGGYDPDKLTELLRLVRFFKPLARWNNEAALSYRAKIAKSTLVITVMNQIHFISF